MTDPAVPSGASAGPSPGLISTPLVVYALFAVYALLGIAAVVTLVTHVFPPLAPLGGIVGIVAIILAHVKRGEAAGTWLASHYRWLIRTFWFSVLWGVVGAIIAIILLWYAGLIGLLIALGIWFATAIWVLYRLIRGYVLFNNSQPVPGM